MTGVTPFDINADGIFDFQFSSNGLFASFDTYGTNRASAFIDPTLFYEHQIVPVTFGVEIGANSSFPYTSLPGAWHSASEIPYPPGFLLGYATSGFMQYARAYIAVEFLAADGIHYGWIQYEGFSVARPLALNTPGGFVDSWGWETQPNTPIFAGQTPEPSRVVYLLLGMTPLLRRRRRALGSG